MDTVESTFLDGKVLKRTLPAMRPPVPAEAPVLKRLLLPQGELAQFHDGDDPVRYLAYIELLEGQARGNHYHKVKEESVYVIRGELELIVEDLASRAREVVPLRGGDLAVIQPGIAHALRTVKSGQAVEFSKARFDPADTYRFQLSSR